MFLTERELEALTGYRRASAQVSWLRKAGIRHYVRRDGRPVVVKDSLITDPPGRKRPDFSKIEEAAKV